MKEDLFRAALAALENAYAPYSGYRVGAAVMSDDSSIFSGCNVENAVYPLGQCAERVAIQSMVAAGRQAIAGLLLVTENAATPCGACRQVISEFASPQTPVYTASLEKIVSETTVAELLPDAFKSR